MAARVEEAYSERDEAIDAKGNVTEVEIPYLVFDVRDESEALAAVRGNHKAVSGMSLASVETVERVNGDTWKVKAVYEADEDGGTTWKGDTFYSFDAPPTGSDREVLSPPTNYGGDVRQARIAIGRNRIFAKSKWQTREAAVGVLSGKMLSCA